MSDSPGIELALFLGGIWAAGKGMLDASSFVNGLRDAVVTGVKDGVALTFPHRRTLRIDWLLTMMGTVLFPVVYSVLLFVIADRLKTSLGGLHTVLLVVCVVPLAGSILFTCCGVLDWRLMSSVLGDTSEAVLRQTAVPVVEATADSDSRDRSEPHYSHGTSKSASD